MPLGPTTAEQKPFGTAQGTRLPVLAIGGHGSTLQDGFFPALDKIAPGAVKIPLRGTGHGIAQLGVGNASGIIKSNLDYMTASGEPIVAVGNSIGGPLLRNVLNKNPNPLVNPIYVDPPKLKWWQGPPKGMRFLSPTAKAIQTANDSGIATDPNTINWTDGNWFNVDRHSPWNATNSPTSAEQVQQFNSKIGAAAGAFSAKPGMTNYWKKL